MGIHFAWNFTQGGNFLRRSFRRGRRGTPPAPRERTLGDLKKLQQSVIATTAETLALIEKEQLQDLGCGAVDMSLLASVILTPETLLWTVDKNLDALARRLGLALRDVLG